MATMRNPIAIALRARHPRADRFGHRACPMTDDEHIDEGIVDAQDEPEDDATQCKGTSPEGKVEP